MNQEVKKRWVEALRSGKYKQGEQCLTQIDDDGQRLYCCLGVLCDLAAKELPDLEKGEKEVHLEMRGKPVKAVMYGTENEVSILPRKVIEWAGLSDPNPRVKTNNENKFMLSELNDSMKYKFNQIADLIEKQL
ncbi:MAG: hypothetical protein HC836_41225 [Richelia sp. RM2_1_2]|nr:hypothetical protein [Richelia sp. RM2_1_2]